MPAAQTAIVYDPKYFFERIATKYERPRDRFFCAALLLWKWQADWAEAKAAEDYDRMENLDHEYNMICAL